MPGKKTLAQFIFNVLSANNTREGYKYGFNDSTHGRTARPGSYRIRPLNYIVGFDHATATYSGGYSQGYSDGLKVEYGIFPIADSSLNETQPARPYSYKGDYLMSGVKVSSETIGEVINKVKQFNDEISQARENLEGFFRNLYNNGQWKDNQFNTFVNTFVGPAAGKIKEAENCFSNEIDNDAIAWLTKLKTQLLEIEALSRQLNTEE